MSELKKLSVVLLAAGESRRMGETNKLTLPVDGVPLLRRMAMMLSNYGRAERCGFAEVVVVTGHEQREAVEQLSGLPTLLAHNPNYTDGQMSSVVCGLQALSQPVDGVMICLSDLPLLDLEDLRTIHQGFSASDKPILVPTFNSQRGNPIVLAAEQVDEIIATGRNLGCRNLIEREPQRVATLEMPNDHVVIDMDTPDNYKSVQARLAESSISHLVDAV